MTQTAAQRKAAAAKGAATKAAKAEAAAAANGDAAEAKTKGPAAAAITHAFAASGAGAVAPASAAQLAKKLAELDVVQTAEDEAAAAVQAAFAEVTDTGRISHGQALLIVAQLRAAS